MTMIYRGMDRAALDAAYNNTKAIPDFPETMERFRARSAALYAGTSGRRDIAYGPLARERFDWLTCGRKDAPVFVFIHGGYWQNCTKEDFAFIASGPLEHGFDVLLVEYELAPAATMTQIVAQIRRLLDGLAEGTFGMDLANRRVCLAGHSAGGQLAALHRAHPLVTHVMPVSALVELEPISLSWLDEKLKLTPHEIDIYSPMRHIARGAPMTVTVGAAELPELVRHSREYAEACKAAGEAAEYLPVPACTHFSVLEDLASASGVQMSALARSMRF
jgi:acetyl esterase/lipase